MIIKNADVYTQDNVFVKGDVVVDNGTFTKVLEAVSCKIKLHKEVNTLDM